MHSEGDQNSRYNSVVVNRLNEIIPKIVDAFDPEEIIMYGSYARGDNDIYSDIDLFIIANTNLRFQDRSLKVLDIVSDNNDGGIPINPLVYTPQEFQDMICNGESFLLSALDESVLLWKKESGINLDIQLETKGSESEFKKYIPC